MHSCVDTPDLELLLCRCVKGLVLRWCVHNTAVGTSVTSYCSSSAHFTQLQVLLSGHSWLVGNTHHLVVILCVVDL